MFKEQINSSYYFPLKNIFVALLNCVAQITNNKSTTKEKIDLNESQNRKYTWGVDYLGQGLANYGPWGKNGVYLFKSVVNAREQASKESDKDSTVSTMLKIFMILFLTEAGWIGLIWNHYKFSVGGIITW